MDLSEMLKILAEGVNPETGEELSVNSETEDLETVNMLLKLADELPAASIVEQSKRLFGNEKMEQNLEFGRPARSHYPWIEEEKKSLEENYLYGTCVEDLAAKYQRTEKAIALQLQKMGVITEEDSERYECR